MALNYALWDASAISDKDWQGFKALWKGQPAYQSGFMDPEFARLIQEVRGDVSVLVAEESGEIVAYWPMHIGAGRWARGVGSPFSDRNGPIVREGNVFDIQAALQAVSLSGFSTHGLVTDSRTLCTPLDKEEVFLSDVSMGYPEFLKEQARLHGSYYKKIRRMMRKADLEFETVKFTFDDRSDEAFEQLMSLKQRQYHETCRHDVLQPDWVRSMLEGLRSGPNKDSQTILSTLYFDEKLAAAELNLRCGSVLHGWLVAYDPRFKKFSPGQVILQRILEAMPENGLNLYDSGTGAGYYKKYFSNYTEHLGVGTIAGCDNKLNPVNILGTGWAFLEKQSPDAVAEQLGRIRRRYDQVVSTETRLDQKAFGMAKALKAIGSPRGS